MKLNPDCIRDILLLVEDKIINTRTCITLDTENIPTLFPNYSIDEIQYHIRQCHLNNFLFQSKCTLDEAWYICDLTPAAHNFLADIREDSIWNNIKEISAKVGSKSLNTIIQIASGVVTALIKSQLGI